MTAFAIGLGIGFALGAGTYHLIIRACIRQAAHDDGMM